MVLNSIVHKIELQAKNRSSYTCHNQGGLKIKGCNIEGPLYCQHSGKCLHGVARDSPVECVINITHVAREWAYAGPLSDW